MSNVVQLDEMRPHRTADITCGRCAYRWVAVFPENTYGLCCPECGGYVNDYGTPVSRHICMTCNRPYTVCPEVIDDEHWKNCLADDCKSYDPSRDLDNCKNEIHREPL